MRVPVLLCMLASTHAFSNQNVFKSGFALQLNEADKTSKTELEMIRRPEAPSENDEEKARKQLMSRLRKQADKAKLLAAEARYRHYYLEGNFEQANQSWNDYVDREAAKRRSERIVKIKELTAPVTGVLRALYFPWFGMLPGQDP